MSVDFQNWNLTSEESTKMNWKMKQTQSYQNQQMQNLRKDAK